MEVVFTTKQAPGALPNGTLVEKVNSTPEDGHQDGARAKVVGSIGPFDDPMIPGKYGYWVEWNDLPLLPVFIGSSRIRVVAID